MVSLQSSQRPADLFENHLLWAWADTAKVGLCVLDSAGAVVAANTMLAAQFSTDRQELLGAFFPKFLLRIGGNDALAKWAVTIDADGTREQTFQRDHRQVDLTIEARSFAYQLNGERFRVLTISDDTDRKQAKLVAALDNTTRQWEALHAGIVISDALHPDMPIIYVNAAFERITGYSPSEVIGRNCRFLQRDETDQPGLSLLRDAIKSEAGCRALLRNYRKDGTMFMNELFVSPVRDIHGRVIQFVGVQHLRIPR